MKRLITLLTFIVFSFSGVTFAQEEGAGGGGGAAGAAGGAGVGAAAVAAAVTVAAAVAVAVSDDDDTTAFHLTNFSSDLKPVFRGLNFLSSFLLALSGCGEKSYSLKIGSELFSSRHS